MFYLQVMSNISVDGEGRFGKGRCPKCHTTDLSEMFLKLPLALKELEHSSSVKLI